MDIRQLQLRQAQRLIFLGMLLFLFGLGIGLLIPALANPRMGLSSHIEGVLNGMLLVMFGLIWTRVRLSARWLKASFWLAVYGTFANCFGILVAAVFDAGAMLNVAAEGREGPAFAEAVVTASLMTLTVAMLVVSVAVLIGLRKGMRESATV